MTATQHVYDIPLTTTDIDHLAGHLDEYGCAAVLLDASSTPWTLFADDNGDFFAHRVPTDDETVQAATVSLGWLWNEHKPLRLAWTCGNPAHVTEPNTWW